MKKLLDKITNYMYRYGFKSRLIFTYFIVALVSVIVISLFLYGRIESIVLKESMEYTQQTTKNISSDIDQIIENTSYTSNQIMANEYVQKIIYIDIEKYELGDQLADFRVLKAFIQSVEDNYIINRIRLSIQDGLLFSNENINIFSMDKREDDNQLNNDQDEPNIYYQRVYYLWNNYQNVITLKLPVPSYKGDELIAILEVDILITDIENIFEINKISSTSLIVLFDDKYNVIGSSNNYISSESEIEYGPLNKAGEMVNVYDKDYYVYDVHSELTGLTIRYYLPLDSIMSKLTTVRRDLVLVLLVIIAAVFLIIVWTTNINTKRLRLLAASMKNMQKGDLSTQTAIHSSKDDLGILERRFNALATSINNLLDEQKEQSKKLLDTELKLLQSQINPHFLYNSLDLINWRVIELGDYKTSKTIQDLAKFYKTSLSGGISLITLKQEINHAKLYVEIQNQRFDNQLSMECHIDEEIQEYIIPKITLQPLIENSIIHGFLSLSEGVENAKIIIKAKKHGDDILLTIADNGIGMADDELDNILLYKNNGSFGVHNVLQRLILLFGEKYGIKYKHNQPNGVIVELLFPAQLKSDM